jgi:hypothetical protein
MKVFERKLIELKELGEVVVTEKQLINMLQAEEIKVLAHYLNSCKKYQVILFKNTEWFKNRKPTTIKDILN